MAKIIHYKNPIDSSQVETLETSVTIRQALHRLGIENDELGVSINGKYPIDLDLDYKPSDSDVIEIRHAVHGGGNSETKSTLATVVQLVAVVAATVLSGGGYAIAAAAVALAGSAASAALMKWSRDLAMAGMQSGSAEADADTSTNSYSLSSTANEARPGRPVQLLLGNHRIVPDIQTDALRFVYGFNVNPTTATSPAVTSFYPGIESTNGPNSPDSNWISMPKNFISSGFPQYDIKIAPYGMNVPSGPLTPEMNTYLCNLVKYIYEENSYPSHLNWNKGGVSIGFGPQAGEFYPLVIYHTDSTDPLHEKYGLFYLIARVRELGRPYSDITNLFAGSYGVVNPGGSGFSSYEYVLSGGLFHNNIIDPPTQICIRSLPTIAPSLANTNMNSGPYRDQIRVVGDYYYPTTIPNSVTVANFYSQFGAWLRDVLNGNANHGGTTSFAIENSWLISSFGPFKQENKLASSQIFNYGVGDLTITDRKVSNTSIDLMGGATDANGTAYSQYMQKDNPLFGWLYQYVVPYYTDVNTEINKGGEKINFSANVKRYDNKRLTCSDGYPIQPVSLNDFGDYNFLYYKGKSGQNAFRFVIQGQLYGTSGGGFVANTCRLEVQYKLSSEASWSHFGSVGILDISNNTTKKVSINIEHPSPLAFVTSIGNDSLEVRLRKVTPDSVTNGENKMCELHATDFCFYTSGFATLDHRNKDCMIPSRLEGLVVTSNLTDAGQTNKYSAYARSKCWVYDFDTDAWNWQFNENPAWWFLYFARGGFTNRESLASTPFSYPFSPTNGWQNYPGHPNNEYHIFGAGLTDDKIDIDKLKEWAQFCDDKELTCNMIVKDDTSVNDILERIANTGRGSVTYYRGVLSVNYEDGAQVPTCMFGMGNILAGSFSVDYLVHDMPRRVKGNYIDRTDWETKKVIALVPFSNEDNLKEVEVNLEGITDKDLAQRAVNILAGRQYYQRRTYKWSVDIEGLLAKRGDLVYLSHDSTQYGYSGRVSRFDIVAGNVVSIETQSSLDSNIQYITIRDPQNEMHVYQCHLENNKIVFDESYPISKAPFYYSDGLENSSSLWANSIPEDFVFIAGAKETPGKIVRISSIEASDDYTFNITAVDEDPAMWALEYDNIIPEESMDDSELVLEISQLHYKILGNGLVKFYWNGPEFIQIINLNNNQPIEANGAFSFTGGEVTVELQAGFKYELEVKPFSIGNPYKSVSQKITLWA